MTTLHDAARQALEALEFFRSTAICAADTDTANEAITALRAALEEPQTTHSAECWRWHHRCAVAKIERECKHD